MKLLTRTEFTQLTLASTNMHCLDPHCSALAVDAHHIFNRNLWVKPEEFGGYFLENGAPLCARHHLEAETTDLAVKHLFDWKKQKPVYPSTLTPGKEYDTWGNEIKNPMTRIPGPLFDDPGCQKALSRSHVLWTFAQALYDRDEKLRTSHSSNPLPE